MQKMERKRSKQLPFRLDCDKDGKIQYLPLTSGDSKSILDYLKELMGTANDDLTQDLIATAALGLPIQSDMKQMLLIAAQVLAECQPSDLHEARLCLQAHNLFSHGMHYLAQARQATAAQQGEFYIKSASKLLRLHAETIEALNRYRRKGEQK